MKNYLEYYEILEEKPFGNPFDEMRLIFRDEPTEINILSMAVLTCFSIFHLINRKKHEKKAY